MSKNIPERLLKRSSLITIMQRSPRPAGFASQVKTVKQIISNSYFNIEISKVLMESENQSSHSSHFNQVFICLLTKWRYQPICHPSLNGVKHSVWRIKCYTILQTLYCQLLLQINKYKTGAINDPLGQTHSHASSEHCFLLFCFSRFEKWGRTNGRTTCAKTIIPTGRDFGLAEWINILTTYLSNNMLSLETLWTTYSHT